MKDHHMNLSETAFNLIKDGTKTLEIRLFDEKRRVLNIGDIITFTHKEESVSVKIIGLSRFANFVDLFTTLGGIKAGWLETDSPIQMVQDMRKYYSEEEEKHFGVLGIHILL